MSSTLIYPVPPPTVNKLDSHQRTRLLRSTRKLEAVLGTTPIFIEPERTPLTPRTKAYRRGGRFFERSPNSSESEDSGPEYDGSYITTTPLTLTLSIYNHPNSSSSSQKKQQQLHLHLQPLPKHRSKSAVPLSPVNTTITSPRINQSQEHEKRRRKLAKLARTLGENVPPELVFPPSVPTASTHSHSPSLPIVIPSTALPPAQPLPPPPASAPTTTSSPPQPTLAERRNGRRPRSLTLPNNDRNPGSVEMPPSLADLYRPLPAPPRPAPAPVSLRDLYTPLPQCPGPNHRHARSSPSNASAVTVATTTVRASSLDTSRHASPPSSHHRSATSASSASQSSGYRREREWSGEWNHEMDEVVKKLRALGR